MKTLFVPLRFRPVYQNYLWGGNLLRTRLARADAPEGAVAESWEIADRDDGMGVVAEGPFRDQTLRQLMERHGPEILGPKGAPGGGRFPLLIKVLDAAQTLSVQVHPNDETARRHGGEAKTEMWYVIDAEPGSVVYCGLKEGTRPETLRAAIDANQLEPLMKTLPVKPGDALFVPGGRVHAIGAGCLLLEVQQNSNTTYRIYDWGRTGPDGKARELHIDQALQVTLWEDPDSALTPAQALEPLAGFPRKRIMESPYFRLESLLLTGAQTVEFDGQSFQVLFAIDGGFTVTGNGTEVDVPRGASVLLPAALTRVHLAPRVPGTQVMRIFLP
jgi:mannose-6-phosphate isomerase